MQYKKFVMSLGDDGTQEAELNRFLRRHNVVNVERQFIEESSMWVFLVCYEDDRQSKSSQRERFNPASELTEGQLERYKRYSDIRMQLANKNKVPVYIIFTNRELAELARLEERPTELMLRSMKGMGDVKMEKYGKDFLRLLNEENDYDRQNSEVY